LRDIEGREVPHGWTAMGVQEKNARKKEPPPTKESHRKKEHKKRSMGRGEKDTE